MTAATLDAVFAALADPTRRAILARLAAGEASVSELAAPFDVSLPAISKHLRVLEDAGLLAREKDGRVSRCRLEAAPMQDAADWIAQYRRVWERQLDALDAFLSQTKGDSSWPSRKPRPTPRSRSHAPSPRRATKSSGRGPTRKR